jgi:hypothetical protein
MDQFSTQALSLSTADILVVRLNQQWYLLCLNTFELAVVKQAAPQAACCSAQRKPKLFGFWANACLEASHEHRQQYLAMVRPLIVSLVIAAAAGVDAMA